MLKYLMATKKLQRISRQKESEEFEWTDPELELLLDTLLIYKESMERNGINWEQVKDKYGTIHRLFILNLQCCPHLCDDIVKRTRVMTKAKIKISVRALRQGYHQTLREGGLNRKNLSTFLVKCKEIWGDCKERSQNLIGDRSLESLLSENSNDSVEISSMRSSVRKKNAYERRSLPCLRDARYSVSNDSGISIGSNEETYKTKKVSRTPSFSNIKRTYSHKSDLSKPLSPRELTKVVESQQNNLVKDEIVQKIEEMHLNHTKAMNCLQEKFQNFAEIIQDMLELRSSNPKNFNQHYYNIAFLEDMVTKSSEMAFTVQNELSSSIAALDPNYESSLDSQPIPIVSNDPLLSDSEQLSFDDSYCFEDEPPKSIHPISEIQLENSYLPTKLNTLRENSIENLYQRPRTNSYDLANYQPYDPLKQYLRPGESLLDK